VRIEGIQEVGFLVEDNQLGTLQVRKHWVGRRGSLEEDMPLVGEVGMLLVEEVGMPLVEVEGTPKPVVENIRVYFEGVVVGEPLGRPHDEETLVIGRWIDHHCRWSCAGSEYSQQVFGIHRLGNRCT